MDALGQPNLPETEKRSRDQLLPDLMVSLATNAQVDSAEALVDAAVSIGLVRANEKIFDYAVSLSIASEILASGGEFPRLKEFRSSFSDIAGQFQSERPYLALALLAFSRVINGNIPDAVRRLNEGLGLGDPEQPPLEQVTADWTSVSEVFLANALRRWLITGSIERLEESRAMAAKQNDALLFASASLLVAYAQVAAILSLSTVAPSVSPIFDSPQLKRFLQGSDIKTIFPSQSDAIHSGILEQGSFLVAMPTSSGKTFLAVLRIAADLTRSPNGRVIYLAPYRLLANQVATEMRRDLSRLRLRIQDLGSSYDVSLDELFPTDDLPDVAVMTPERLDALIRLADSDRRGADTATNLIETTVLIVLDEVQLVGRLPRGPRYELFLTRLRKRFPDTPILGLAALSQGVTEFSEWLEARPVVSAHGRPTGLMELLWRPDGSIYQRFAGQSNWVGQLDRPKASIDAAAALVIRMRWDRYPVLIVETTRDYAENVVRKVARVSPRDSERWRASLDGVQRNLLDRAATAADATLGSLNDLGDLIRQGLAFHHAGLPSHLLRQIENLVRQKAIRAVGATTTVAEGADLPFQVVIIPHLNFGSGAARLERNLYENIIGRAGRSNVAVEGLVVTIGSEAPSLRNYVERVLWNEARTNTLQGQLNRGLNTPTNIEEYRVRREIESQVLAWLGDPDSETEEQGHQLAASTFSWASASQLQRNLLEQGFDDILEELERSGLARAASPLQLTSLGRRARLAGMGPASCLRLSTLVGRLGESKALAAFEGASEISLELANIISALAFETEEVVEWSLWFRSLRTSGDQEVQVFRDLTFGAMDWPYDDPIFMTDIELLSSWIVGMSYSELAQIPPIFGGRGIFGSSDLGKRSADAALQMGRIAYPSSWAWGAATAIMGEDGEALPTWIRHGIEFGVPTETAVELIRNFGVSRASSVALSSVLSPNWSSAEAELLDLGESDLRALGVTEIDRSMLMPSLD